MIKYKQGDLLKAFENGEVNLIAHQENCVSKGNYAGIAKIIHNKYPETVDISRFFGDIIIHHVQHGIIVNLYSQYYPGSPNSTVFVKDKYELIDNYYNRIIALEECLWKIRMYFSDKKIGLPLLASGLAACKGRKTSLSDLDYFKKYITPTVEKCLDDMNVTVYYL